MQTITKVKKTRKDATCAWCREKIEKGDASVTVHGLYDGEFYRNKFHNECHDAALRYFSENQHEEDMPFDPMNRGGIQPRGEPETP